MPDTVSPYDDEVVDPYADDDDVKNPHEATEGAPAADEDPAAVAAPRKPTRPAKKTTKR